MASDCGRNAQQIVSYRDIDQLTLIFNELSELLANPSAGLQIDVPVLDTAALQCSYNSLKYQDRAPDIESGSPEKISFSEQGKISKKPNRQRQQHGEKHAQHDRHNAVHCVARERDQHRTRHCSAQHCKLSPRTSS